MSSETEWAYKGPKATSDAPRGYEPVQGANWVLFAGIMMVLVGVLNVIYGVAAVSKSSFLERNADFMLTGLRTWGWIGVALGALQIAAAYGIWRGSQAGRWFGIVLAGASLVGALMSIQAYPFWSLTIVAIDVLVLFGLAAYGGQHKPV